MTQRALVVALLLAVPLAGCIENMSDLKDRLQGGSTDVLPPTNDTVKNTTFPKVTGKEPVARMDIYEKGGAKLFASDFVASDGRVETATVGGKDLSFVGSSSEALDKNATVKSYAWNFGDGAKATGSTATHAFPTKGGVFTVTLTITDSKGRTDAQTVKIAANPALVVANSTADGAIDVPSLGVRHEALADRTSASFPFVVAATLDGSEVTAVSTVVKVVPKNTQAVDLGLSVRNATEQVGSSNGAGAEETVTLEAPAAGDYTAIVYLDTGAQAQFTILIETVYQPVNHEVMAFFGGHGGGHQH